MSELTLNELNEAGNLSNFLIKKGNGIKGLSDLNLKNAPNQFIQQERLDHIKVSVEESIPVIDVSKWDNPHVSESVCDAAAKWGFFQIINHGIPDEVAENVRKAARDFYDLPVEERKKYLKENSPTPTVMLKSCFSPLTKKLLEWEDHLYHFVGKDQSDHSQSQLWPPVSRDGVLEYINWARPVIRKLLEVLLDRINVKQIDEAKEAALMGLLITNLVCYPICPNPNSVAGSARHSDASTITFLLQDDEGGLFVRAPEGDRWIHVTPIKGSIVVNVGDVLQIMSNGKYKSVEHRVSVSGSMNKFFVPIFANPLSSEVIGPLQEGLEDGEKPIYKHVLYSDYMNYFFSKGHDGTPTIDYAKL